MPEISGALDASDMTIGIAVSTFNPQVTDGLLSGAMAVLGEANAEEPTIVRVPGAFELPIVSKALVEAGHDCVIALGAVVEGETDHYTHIATQAAAGLRQLSVQTGVPVAFGILTVRDSAHAVARSQPGPKNKGAEAANAAIRAANLIRRLAN